jgi:thiol-disulfide isomerase/thioredoxin
MTRFVCALAALLAPLAPLTIAAQDRMMGPSPQDRTMSPPAMMMMSSGGKATFTSLEDAKARAAKGPAVLMFAADWCPTCQAALTEITKREAELGDVSVVVVDYDHSRDLQKMYGVTYRHTFVQIDAAGAKVASWNGGGVDEVLRRVKRGM